MKKILITLLCMMLLLSLAACGDKEEAVGEAPVPETVAPVVTEAVTEAPEPPEIEAPAVAPVETQAPVETAPPETAAQVIWTWDTVPRPSEREGERYSENEVWHYFQNMTAEDAAQKLADYLAALENAGFAFETMRDEETFYEVAATNGNAHITVIKEEISSSIPNDIYVHNMGVGIVLE